MKGLVLPIMVCVCTLAHAWEIESLDVTRDQAQFKIKASVFIQAPTDLIYGALTDFENLNELLKGIRESRQLTGIESDSVHVFTKRRSCFFVFCFTSEVVEKVTYPEPGVIVSTIVPGQSDFKSGYMRWRLTQTSGGTRIAYDAEMIPDFWIPKAIGTGAIKRNMTRQLKKMGNTLEDRAQRERG